MAFLVTDNSSDVFIHADWHIPQDCGRHLSPQTEGTPSDDHPTRNGSPMSVEAVL
jgi:hypothetical protein